MNELLAEIAHCGQILPPLRRLRLLLDAALAETGADIISCFLHADFIPFASALTEAAMASGNPAPIPCWPLCFPGVYDPVPLFAMLSLNVARQIFEMPDGDYQPKDWYQTEEAFRFGFSYRENVSHFRKRTVRDGERVLAVLFLSHRFPADQDAPPVRAKPRRKLRSEERGALSCSDEQTDELAELVREILSETQIPDDEQRKYGRLTKQVLSRARSFAQIGDSTPDKLEALRRFFQWLLDAAISIIDEPTLVASAFCVASPHENGGTYVIGSHPPLREAVKSRLSLCLLPLSDSGLHEPLRKRVVSRPFQYGELLRTLVRAEHMLASSHVGRSRPFWSPRPFQGLPHPASRCGLITVATHMGAPLYLPDVQRRFCAAAPLYGLAYAEPFGSCRTALCIPLLKHFGCAKDDKGVRRDRAIGAVSLETERHLAIRPGDASYLACLFHEATQYLPETLFDWNTHVPCPERL